jgi:hypothetical protein
MPSDDDAAMMQNHRYQRQLSLQLRPSSTNQFARLSPKIAQELLQQAAVLSNDHPLTVAGWRASDALMNGNFKDYSSGVEFLALEIILNDGSKIYASYNGGSVDNDGKSVARPSDSLNFRYTSEESVFFTFAEFLTMQIIRTAAFLLRPYHSCDIEIIVFSCIY